VSWFKGAPLDAAGAAEFVRKLTADRKGFDAFMARMRAATPQEQALLFGAAQARFGAEALGVWEATAFVAELTVDRTGLDTFQGRLAASNSQQQLLLIGAAKLYFGEEPLQWWAAIAQARGGRTNVTIAAAPPGGGGGKAAAVAVGALFGNPYAGAVAAGTSSVNVNDRIHVPPVCNICGVYEGKNSTVVSKTVTSSEIAKALGGSLMGDTTADLHVPTCPICDKYPNTRKQLAPTFDYLKAANGWRVVLTIACDTVAERYAALNQAEVSGTTPLAFAAWKGHLDTVTSLLAAGTEVDTRDKNGTPPLMLAAAGGQRETIAALLAAGADVNATNDVGNTALILASAYGQRDSVAALLGVGARIGALDKNGNTALATAAMKGHAEVVATLLAAGADAVLRNTAGKSALDVARELGYADVVHLLTTPGADVRPAGSNEDGVTPSELVTSISEAKQCLGANNVFGPHEWLRYFPKQVTFSEDQLAGISEIPWPKSVLTQPSTIAEGRVGEHFLFLGLERIESAAVQRDLNLFTWIEICHSGMLSALEYTVSQEIRGAGGPKFSEPHAQRDWYQRDWSTPKPIGSRRIHYTNLTCEFRWYFVPVDVLKYTIGVPEIHEPCEYDIATTVETVTANILFHLLNHKFMSMAGQIARTSDSSLSKYGQSVCVWSDRNGLSVGTVTPGEYPGAALSRSPHV